MGHTWRFTHVFVSQENGEVRSQTCMHARGLGLGTIYDLGSLAGRQSSRPACHPTRSLGLGSPGWGAHVLLGTGTTDCSGNKEWECEGGRLLRENVVGEDD